MGWVKSTSAGAFAALLAACTGAAGTDLFGDPGLVDGGAGGAGGAQDGAATQGDGATGGPRDAAPAGKDSATPAPDAAPPPPPPVDAAPPTDPGIHCGNTNCIPGAQECCRTGNVGAESFKCVTTGKCQSGSSPMAIPCDDAFDCAASGSAGQVCCATYEVNGTTGQDHVIDVACMPAADCDGTQMMITMCSLLDPAQCPTGTSCKASTQTFVGYDLCL